MKHSTTTTEKGLSELARLRPRTPDDLHGFVRTALGLEVARTVVSPGSTPPFDYLCHSFFESPPESPPELPTGIPLDIFPEIPPEVAAPPGDDAINTGHHGTPSRDCVVWANRGGGKTMLGAVATLLDLVFKPGVQVRILGGSLEQATKMHEHLTALFDRALFRDLLSAPPTTRRIVLRNGSRVEVLAGSQRSVRGVRVHKLRCDEVEELDPAVWEAAQLVTRSGWCGGVWVRGAVEALSTMHRVRGTMAQLVGDDATPATAKVFRWNAMDVAARCPASRACEGCELWDDCGGRAKEASGFVPVEDLVNQWRRASGVAWSAEMMCRRPGVRHAVYPGFDEAVHVCDTPPWAAPVVKAAPVSADASVGGPSGGVVGDTAGGYTWTGGMDFGLRCPMVMLWACSTGVGPEAAVHVVAEYDAKDLTLERNLQDIDALRETLKLPTADALAWAAVDPAGNARNAHSGSTDVAVLRRHGYRVRTPRDGIAQGVEVVRRRLDRGTLSFHPRCKGLIAAMKEYHFDPGRPDDRNPVKDGPDHWCDALRYLLMQMERATPPVAGRYA